MLIDSDYIRSENIDYGGFDSDSIESDEIEFDDIESGDINQLISKESDDYVIQFRHRSM